MSEQYTLMGVLNIDKPKGMTSHDVVARIRRLSGIRRIGHAGTLDPLATGVLLICVGKATRVVSYLTTQRKVYKAVLRLGESTDTYDAEGSITARHSISNLKLEEIEQALARYVGDIQQIPPMYSAIKYQGRSLHQLARAGIEVERQPRDIHIADIHLESWSSPDLSIKVTCSAGTYIRSLAHDLGEDLGCGAHIRELRRSASGSWRVETAVTLDDFLASGDHWVEYLHTLNEALSALPVVSIAAEEAKRFIQGQRLTVGPVADAADVCVCYEGACIGIGTIFEGVLSPRKVLVNSISFDVLHHPG